MKILPPVTRPPRRPTVRRHEPRPARGDKGYQSYRACLRWEFGFTCAFCLSHEVDLSSGRTVEGTGLTGIEHATPQREDRARRNDYSNCYYVCRYCNGARAHRPQQSDGRTLLDPSRTPWGDHFARSGDHLLPLDRDGDAAYTHEVYDLDDPRKVEMRRLRRELISDRLELLRRFPADLSWLLAEVERSVPRRAREALELARRLRRAALHALQELARCAIVPVDAPRQCRCGGTNPLTLPADWEEQALDLPGPLDPGGMPGRKAPS